MQEYHIKRGYEKKLAENMVQGLLDQFGAEPEESGGHYIVSYGALKKLEVWIGAGGKTLIVDTESDMNTDDETIIETNRRFRRYLTQVTGYTTRDRAKKAKKEVE